MRLAECCWDNLKACLYTEAFMYHIYLLAVLRAKVGVRGVQVKADFEADLRSSSKEDTGHTFDKREEKHEAIKQQYRY